jgi:sugar phosphate isomerase/epimerase
MNHPSHDVVEEVRWMAALEMQFIDLTLEPPGAGSWMVSARAIREELARHGMDVVGHTAWYLPLANPMEEVRKAAVVELRRCIEVFAEIGARWMNIHPDRHAPFHDRSFYIRQNLTSLRELVEHGQKFGVGIMVENLPGDFNNVEQLGDLLDHIPELGLHLDIGHANLRVPHNTTQEILAVYGNRLRHVHVHDNKGGDGDLHLPLGAGTIDLRRNIRALQNCGYDGTITLEVFTPDRHHLCYSRDVLRRTWNEVASDRQREAPAVEQRPVLTAG